MNYEQAAYNAWRDEYIKNIKDLAEELGISEATAETVDYFRTRSRHTPELEKELIRLCESGQGPNINEWPARN